MFDWLKSPGFLTQVIIAGILMAVWCTGAIGSGSEAGPSSYPYPPRILNYQGVVKVGGGPHNGTGYFKFAIVDQPSGTPGSNLWSNDGTMAGEPLATVSLPVHDGMFNVLLGDTSITGMTMTVSEYLFMNDNATYLRVWFSSSGTPGTFQALDPNQRIAGVGYALYASYARSAGNADTVDGYSAYSTAQANSLVALDGSAKLKVPQVVTDRIVDSDDDSWSVDPNGNTKLHDVWWTGHLQGMQTSGPYFVVSDGDGFRGINMIPHNNSICFLTWVAMREVDTGDERGRCRIYPDGGYWVLQAWSESGEDNFASCEAWCLQY